MSETQRPTAEELAEIRLARLIQEHERYLAEWRRAEAAEAQVQTLREIIGHAESTLGGVSWSDIGMTWVYNDVQLLLHQALEATEPATKERPRAEAAGGNVEAQAQALRTLLYECSGGGDVDLMLEEALAATESATKEEG